MHACPIPMEDPATTVPRSTRPQRRITPVAGLITPTAVTTRPRAGITHRLHGITSHRRVTITSRGFINRHRAITSRRHEQITGSIRIVDGTVMTVGAGMAVTAAVGVMTIEATAGRIIVAKGAIGAITVVAITMAEAIAGKHSIKKRRMKRRFFCA